MWVLVRTTAMISAPEYYCGLNNGPNAVQGRSTGKIGGRYVLAA